jgi:hypothetical protein
MSVVINWSYTNGGTPLAADVDYGNGAAGTILGPQTIYISQNGSFSLTNCGFYLANKSVYSGSQSPTDDYNELIEWGNAGTSNSWGGVHLNMNAANGFLSNSWPTFANQQPSGGASISTGVGDSFSTTIPLLSAMGLPGTGIIPTGTRPNISFQTRILVPNSVSILGTRQFNLCLKYTYTS